MSFKRNWHGSYPPGVPSELDFEKITMPEFLTRTAERFPRRTALIFMGKKITYRELETMVNRFAKALMEIGVKTGDRVAMLLPNMPQIVIANYAAFRIGAVPVMNDPLCSERKLAHQLDDSASKVLIMLDLLFPRALELKKTTGIRSIIACHVTDFLPFPSNKLLPFINGDLFYKIPNEPGFYEFLPLLNQYPDTPVKNAARWEEVGALLYTGGTTGVGKGAMLTHANISCSTQQLRAWFPDAKDGEESMLAAFPFFHAAGWTGIQNLSILAGWTDILVPRPEPQAIIDILKSHKPTLLPGVPIVYTGLLAREAFRKMSFSSVKAFLTGAAPLPVEVIRELKALKDAPVINIYGLTEIGPVGTATPWGGPEKPGTAGIPLPGTDLKIVDLETGTRELPVGEVGEICFRGPQVMKGYYGKTEETAAVLKGGWICTGDIGFLDTDGYLTLVDRKTELIVADGCHVYPREVDEVLLSHPGILEACTFGVPDENHGEAVKSCVVLKPGEKADKEGIIAHCGEKLAPYKVPKIIEFTEELPKGPLGQFLRHELKAPDHKRQEGKV